jgi:voltage-gated potassium channel Kch
VIVGYGRVGVQIAAMLERADAPFVVIERDHTLVANIRQPGASPYMATRRWTSFSRLQVSGTRA